MPSNGHQPEPRPVTVSLGKGKVDFRVRPSLLRVAAVYGEGPIFQIVNDTDFPVEARFPAGLVLDAGGQVVARVAVGPRDSSVVLRVNLDYEPSEKVVARDYEVWLEITRNLSLEGVGSSRPEIEIRR